MVKSQKSIDNSVTESLLIGQADSLGRLSNPSRVTAYCQSATWRARALESDLLCYHTSGNRWW